MTEAPAVLTERRERVLVITLNRPHVRNAIDLALLSGLADALDDLDADPVLLAGILTGAGGAFSSGMDLRAFVAGEPIWLGGEDGRGMRHVVTRKSRKPLIAAIEGLAVAGGLELALTCDVLVAGRSARFGIPEVKRSIVAGGGALRHLPRRIGPGAAMKLALTGDLIDGAEAQAKGLVDQLVDDGAALEGALELAGAIGRNGPLAVLATRAILREQTCWTDDEFWERQAVYVEPVISSDDAVEGSRAFSEKRAPVWTGR